MRAVVFYTSQTGNTESAKNEIVDILSNERISIEEFCVNTEKLPDDLTDYDIAIVGTYTWGDGEIPHEMDIVYRLLEEKGTKELVTGVFGTGDSCYPHYCGAVDHFRDMLFHCTSLAVTLKIELSPQISDIKKCHTFVERLVNKVKVKSIS